MRRATHGNFTQRRYTVKKFWIVPYCALGLALSTDMAHAAFWQVIRDTPVRESPAADARMLDTARKGWVVNNMTQGDSGLQWIKVVELQKHIGDGMAYAHLTYNTPGEPVYISAADVVQVADLNGTPLKDEADSAATAVTARGVHVELLPTPQTAELSSNGAVDEAALKTALNTWVQNCNAVLGKYKDMDSNRTAKEVITWSDHDTFIRSGIDAVENCVSPLLERWMKNRYLKSHATLSADDQKILDILANYGLIPEIAEGSPFLTADLITLRKRVILDPSVAAYTSYVALLDSQPQILFSDGGCRHSVKKMGTWAVQWEQYLKTVPVDSFYFTEGKKRYLEFATYILFSDLPNTPAFPKYNNGKMEDYWMEELKIVTSENPGTETAALITEFLVKVKAGGNKLAPSAKKALLTKLNALPTAN